MRVALGCLYFCLPMADMRSCVSSEAWWGLESAWGCRREGIRWAERMLDAKWAEIYHSAHMAVPQISLTFEAVQFGWRWGIYWGVSCKEGTAWHLATSNQYRRIWILERSRYVKIGPQWGLIISASTTPSAQMYVHPESSSVADGLCLESFLLHTVALYPSWGEVRQSGWCCRLGTADFTGEAHSDIASQSHRVRRLAHVGM